MHHARQRPRSGAVLAVAQLLWLVGASASYLAGAVFGAATGVGALAATFALTAFVAIGGAGWRAVPRLSIALLLQAPLVVGLGLYALQAPLGDHPYPCFFFHGTALEELEVFTAVAALSAPVGLLLALDGAYVHRLTAVARKAAPVATALSVALAAAAAVRLAKLPTPERYLDSLPVHATIPSPPSQPCARIDDRRDPEHRSSWDREQCATPPFAAAPMTFHFHGSMSDGGPNFYELHFRATDGTDQRVDVWMTRSRAADVVVRRDDALGLYFVAQPREVAVFSRDHARYGLPVTELRGRVAPPLGFLVACLVGVALALASLGASTALGEAARGRRALDDAWIAARRGDLALFALATAVCGSALLVAAGVAGFLV